jgi:hypothetical protein
MALLSILLGCVRYKTVLACMTVLYCTVHDRREVVELYILSYRNIAPTTHPPAHPLTSFPQLNNWSDFKQTDAHTPLTPATSAAATELWFPGPKENRTHRLQSRNLCIKSKASVDRNLQQLLYVRDPSLVTYGRAGICVGSISESCHTLQGLRTNLQNILTPHQGCRERQTKNWPSYKQKEI